MKQIWLMEYGAIFLPFGHPSRITCFKVCDSEIEAEAALAGIEFDARIFPVEIPHPTVTAIRQDGEP